MSSIKISVPASKTSKDVLKVKIAAATYNVPVEFVNGTMILSFVLTLI